MKIIDKLFRMEEGYVLDFSILSFSRFFAEELSIDVDDQKYMDNGGSKGKRLRCLLQKEEPATTVRVLKALWNYREHSREFTGQSEWAVDAPNRFLALLNRIQGIPAPPVASQAPSAPEFDVSNYGAFLDELVTLSALAPQPRGYAFEKFLNRLFQAYALLPRGPFRVTGEQIDGSFVLASQIYLLEAKWQNDRTGANDLHAFQGKFRARANWTRGLFVSYSGFTDEGLTAYGRGGSTICLDGLDLSDMFIRQIPFTHVLEQKVRRLAETGEVLARVRDLFSGRK
jgi:hypothetical protein